MAAKYKICPHCSHKIKTTTTFCIHCGKDLRNVKFVEYNNALVAESFVAKSETKATEEIKPEPTPATTNASPSEVPMQKEVPNTATPFTSVTEKPAVVEPITTENKPIAEPVKPAAEPIKPVENPVHTMTEDVKEEKTENVKQIEPQVNVNPVPLVQEVQQTPSEPQVQTPVQNTASERPNPFKALRNPTVAPVNVAPPIEATTSPNTKIVSQSVVPSTPTVSPIEPVSQPSTTLPVENIIPQPIFDVSQPEVSVKETIAPVVEPVITPTATPVANITPTIAPQQEVIIETPKVTPVIPTQTEVMYEKHNTVTETPLQSKVSRNPLPQSFVLEVPRPVANTEKEPEQLPVEPNVAENIKTIAPNSVENAVFEPRANISPSYAQNEQYEAPSTVKQAENNDINETDFMSDTNNGPVKEDSFMEGNTVTPVPEVEHAKSGVVLGRIPSEEETEVEEEEDIFFKNEDTIREEPYDARKDGYYEDVEAEVEEEIKHTMADSTKKTILAIVLSLIAITIFALWKGYI